MHHHLGKRAGRALDGALIALTTETLRAFLRPEGGTARNFSSSACACNASSANSCGGNTRNETVAF